MSIEGIPHSLRIIGAIPGVFLIAAIPFEYILKMRNKLRQSKYLSYKPWRWTILKISTGGLIAIVVLAGVSQIYLYFGVWAKEPKTAESFERELFDLGKAIHEIELKDNNFLIVAPEVGIFDDHKNTSLKTTEFAGQSNIEYYSAYYSLEGLVKIHCENSQMVFQKSDSWLRDRYKEKCPHLTFEQYTPNNGIYSFWILR